MVKNPRARCLIAGERFIEGLRKLMQEFWLRYKIKPKTQKSAFHFDGWKYTELQKKKEYNLEQRRADAQQESSRGGLAVEQRKTPDGFHLPRFQPGTDPERSAR